MAAAIDLEQKKKKKKKKIGKKKKVKKTARAKAECCSNQKKEVEVHMHCEEKDNGLIRRRKQKVREIRPDGPRGLTANVGHQEPPRGKLRFVLTYPKKWVVENKSRETSPVSMADVCGKLKFLPRASERVASKFCSRSRDAIRTAAVE